MKLNTTTATIVERILQKSKDAVPSVSSWHGIAVDIQITQDNLDALELLSTDTNAMNFSATEAETSPEAYQTLLAVVLALFSGTTVFGNMLVMVAIAKEQYLHTATNYFIASLATADCLVGGVVMPFSIIHEVMGRIWIFGREWCDLWRCFDVLASTASILNLCAISVDRYWAIIDPMTYPSKMTTPRAKLIVGLVWMCSSLISFPAIAWWRAVSVQPYPPDQCLFTDDVGYLLFSSVISFYGPLIIMVFTYCRIYKAAINQTKCLENGMKYIGTSNEVCEEMTLRIHRGGVSEKNELKNGNTEKHKRHNHIVSENDKLSEGEERKSPDNSIPLRFASRHVKVFSISKKLGKLTKERKAAKTLAIVMGVFILCWLPFFIINVLVGICGKSCISEPELVFSIVTWLGWLNSGMNPIIYACWSKDFRKAFRQLLCWGCKKEKQCYKFETPVRRKDILSRSKSPNEEVFL
ncbi:dopamine receptor 2-like [Stegodyphus dumicola]|uniref:dopamine receptor 2-like n=1 Tax=Stegodyphus dumicola TaxID=202533 RepID=UPI0015ADC523|nr:dopamine receptor 2-like [Stegodyphus dumicola]